MPLAETPRTELPERLGVYRIEACLGRGGMGEVYLAWDELLERHVAVKRIRREFLAEAHQRLRFLRETRLVARLDHPSIIRIYHVLERDDGDCLVVGRDTVGRDTVGRDTVGHADQTPAGRVKILDFGLAKALWPNASALPRDEETLTQSGALVGTVYAMSLEQADGRPLDHRSDLFAFGSLTYEMLTGRAPFRSAPSSATYKPPSRG